MAAQAAIYGLAGLRPDRWERAFFREADPWGFILFARNLADAAQIRALTAELRAILGRDAPILIDQEGGRVQRLRPPLARDWPPVASHGAHLPPGDRARLMWLRFRLIAAELVGLGIDVNCAPVADLAEDATHPILKDRCHASTPADTIPLARAAAEGLMAGGCLPVVKHLPGHGRARVDSHVALPRVAAGAEALEAHDFAPFRALADLPLAMTAHVVFDALDPERPATLSPAAIDAIRDRIGFDGLLMTDDLSMRALSGDFGSRVGAALAAGCDVVLHCNGNRDEMAAIAAAAPKLSGRAARRADRALSRRRPPDGADPAALAAELTRLEGAIHA